MARKKERTRQKIIEVAIQCFADYGYDGTSIRTITNYAQVNVSAIAYHFGGKEKLYLAVIEFILGEMQRTLSPHAFHLMQLINEDHPKSYYRDKIIELLIAVANKSLEENTKYFFLIVIKEQIKPSVAADILYERHFNKMFSLIGSLLQKASSQQKSELEVKLMTQALLGEAFTFILGISNLKRELNIDEFDSKHIASLKKILAMTVEGFCQ
ncbi:CerR family C-terminal domain-containing protein [Piscirickettsia litoralis]|uniref:HTH tetR-type domain-containing protein n=1 Tax=Piscirickettsia litoralis TaxID=1891921 RepID=A0ABX3A272_9GAMM|nr:CerR family C-terminal domain-containing protein [Piscirickettsia litoralis]ODN42962.1 hypothetical protein BGC07_08560 [Piscirickettsia litoralis]